jgi:hypothetical protein
VNRTRTIAVIGGVVTLGACGGMVAAGYYFDATGGAPGNALSGVLWGSLLLGLLLLGTALVRWTRDESRRPRT